MESLLQGSEIHTGVTQKRRRVDKACETCRRRKERCDGVKPACSNCRTSGRQCAYSSESKRRGLPEGWVRSLEKIWGLAIAQNPSIEKDVLAAVRNGIDAEHGDFTALWTDEQNHKGFFGRWRSSRLSRELDELLPALESLPQRKIEDEITSTAEVVQASAAISLPEDTLTAIDAYVTFTHPGFPVIEKQELYRTYRQWSTNGSDIASGDRACLLAILAYQGVHHSHSDRSQLSDISWDQDGLFLQVRNLMPARSRDCKLSHVQAMLLLSLAHFGASLWDDAWLLLGQAIRMALLERTVASNGTAVNGSPAHTEGSLYYVLGGCFIFDSLVSGVAALPAHLRYDDLLEIAASASHLTDTFDELLVITRIFSRVAPKARAAGPTKIALESIEADVEAFENRQSSGNGVASSLQNSIEEVVISPDKVTVHLVHLCTLVVLNTQKSTLAADLEGLKFRLGYRLIQLEGVLKRVTELDCNAMPLFWQLTLGIILNEVKKARKIVHIELPVELLQVLEQILGSGRNRWPCFEWIHGYISTLLAQASIPKSA